LPSVLQNPKLEAAAFILRAPKLPPQAAQEAPPAVYSEEQMRVACEEAERTGAGTARASCEEALALMEERTAEVARDFLAAGRELSRERIRVLEGASRQVIDLAFTIAGTVLRKVIDLDSAAVVPLVRELLQRTASAGTITIRLAPREHAYLLGHAGTLPEASGLEGLRLRADSNISPGGCVLETEAGSLDGRLETQLERIAAALTRAEETP
jgi:flagellar assembly protein FliH